jgi:hypothetical protein
VPPPPPEVPLTVNEGPGMSCGTGQGYCLDYECCSFDGKQAYLLLLSFSAVHVLPCQQAQSMN